MSPLVRRAVKRMRADAIDADKASELLLMTAAIAEWIERLDLPLPVTGGAARRVILDAADALEGEHAAPTRAA